MKKGVALKNVSYGRPFEGYLPKDILWRQKDGMSDAVGVNWVDEVKNMLNLR